MTRALASVRRVVRESLYRRILAAMWSAAPGFTAGLGSCVAATVGLTVVQVLAAGSLVGSLPDALRGGPDSGAAHRVEQAVALLGAALFLQVVVAGVGQALAPTIGRRVEVTVRGQVMSAALAPAGVAHLQDPTVVSEIEDATTVGTAWWGPSTAVESLTPMVVSLLSGLAMAVVVGTYRWWLGVALAGAWLFARDFRRREQLDEWAPWGGSTLGPRRQAYFRRLCLTPPAAKELRIFGLARWSAQHFHETWLGIIDRKRQRRQARRAHLVTLFLFLAAANVLAFVVIARGVEAGDLGLGSLTVLLQATMRTNSIGDMGAMVWDAMFAAGASTLGGVQRLSSRLGQLEPESSTHTAASAGEIRFSAVSFQYPTANRAILRDLDLTLSSGRSFALVGENGCGKTTLVRLLGGLLEPTKGSISSGGVPIAELDLAAWRSSLAVVFQDFARFAATARDNVTFGAIGSTPSDARLEAVATRAGLTDLLDHLPARWDTPLSREITGGADLSGGEWQRVALARALLAVEHGASILVLDEPTASLDVRAEAAFIDRFLELTTGLTTLVISHRFSTVRHADEIGVLADGRIVERGSHAELMALGGHYARLFTIQAEAFGLGDGAEEMKPGADV